MSHNSIFVISIFFSYRFFYIQNKIGLKNLRKIALEAEEKKDVKEAESKKADPLTFVPSKIEKEKIEMGKNI